MTGNTHQRGPAGRVLRRPHNLFQCKAASFSHPHDPAAFRWSDSNSRRRAKSADFSSLYTSRAERKVFPHIVTLIVLLSLSPSLLVWFPLLPLNDDKSAEGVFVQWYAFLIFLRA